MTGIPHNARRIPLRPLALGEATGHHHSLVADDPCAVEMYELDGQVFVRASGSATEQHQEHKPHLAPAGTEWGIRIATEVTDWGRAPVRD